MRTIVPDKTCLDMEQSYFIHHDIFHPCPKQDWQEHSAVEGRSMAHELWFSAELCSLRGQILGWNRKNLKELNLIPELTRIQGVLRRTRTIKASSLDEERPLTLG